MRFVNAARVVAWLLSGLIRNDSKPATDWAVFLVACSTLFAIQKSVAVAIYEVILFSVLKERLGKPAIRFEADSPVSCRAMLDGLAGRYPPVAEFRTTARLAVNRTYAQDSEQIVEGDEIALITPVSGG